MATAGDKILIQARIYNDSFVDIPSNQTIVVQFYGEPWDPTNNVSTGNAFLIEQKTLDGLPGFASPNASITSPNWTLVGTSNLDTAAYSDQYLVFWVVVFIEQQDSNQQKVLVAEQPDHGLTQLPANPFTSVSDALSVLEPHSNNLGFYKYAFYIAPKNAGAMLPGSKARLKLSNVAASPAKVQLGQVAVISASINSKDSTSGISVAFYNGRPDRGGTLFDIDNLAHIRANGVHGVQTTFHPSSCGKHTIYIVPLDVPFSQKNSVSANVNVLGAGYASARGASDEKRVAS